MTALHRFGLPAEFVEMVKSIYEHREFFVRDVGMSSDLHAHHAGICQGCPLSPFLFVMLMTVLIHDAKKHLIHDLGVSLSPEVAIHDLLYADDTLLIDARGEAVEQFMHCVGQAGREYGIVFNWDKLESMPVRCENTIRKEDGALVKTKNSMVYLGSLLSNDGCIGSELARRSGMAQCGFQTLRRVWSHSNLTRRRKTDIFSACILIKPMYCLHTAYLNRAERRKLNGFQARCLRQIIGVLPSFISRVSNADVLGKQRSTPSH